MLTIFWGGRWCHLLVHHVRTLLVASRTHAHLILIITEIGEKKRAEKCIFCGIIAQNERLGGSNEEHNETV